MGAPPPLRPSPTLISLPMTAAAVEVAAAAAAVGVAAAALEMVTAEEAAMAAGPHFRTACPRRSAHLLLPAAAVAAT